MGFRGQKHNQKNNQKPAAKSAPKPAAKSGEKPAPKAGQGQTRGLIYRDHFVSAREKEQLFKEVAQFFPIWENRFSEHNPPPEGTSQRRLLRPVYWLGNWQFACLNYYHPPKGIEFRCVEAEPFPPQIQAMVDEISEMVRNQFDPGDIPRGWELNTCLINYYGSQIAEDGKRIDVARVGEHKDFEPGPVASVSFGERALFQFVSSRDKQAQSQVVLQQWLEDSSLQIFGGEKFKKKLFHRVQRVDRKRGETLDFHTPDFETRRLNFTFRYVPREHIQPLGRFPSALQSDVLPYVTELAKKSNFFAKVLETL
ncbi:MAG: alpha-ketoglutarate-dependent dioxygenase AlkB [Proteobacteria bacterium]|nr:MAG: alpha-ketoglutarate-dependent dioxygenase AlkB [Pseudomonadota bacterium]